MKKIILPTDFSDNAYNAIDYAVHLFKDVETTFYLLHTYTPAVYRVEYLMRSPSQIGLGDTLQSKAIVELEELQQRLKKEFKNPKHTYVSHSSFNLLVDEVLETIENAKADMVIMGTQGATGAKEIFLGSNTVHIIKKSSCPVIAVPSHFKCEKPKEILFPTDYEVDYKREQLQELIEIAKTHISSIEVIHVSKGYDLTEIQLKYKKQLDHIFTEIAHLFHDMPNQEVITAINAFQMKKRMNLLVMIKNKHTFLERLFIDPIIKKIGFHINVPFMVIPSSK